MMRSMAPSIAKAAMMYVMIVLASICSFPGSLLYGCIIHYLINARKNTGAYSSLPFPPDRSAVDTL